MKHLCQTLLLLFLTLQVNANTISVPSSTNYTLTHEELNSGLPDGYCVFGLDDQEPGASLSPVWTNNTCLENVVLNTSSNTISLVMYYQDEVTGQRPSEFWSITTINVTGVIPPTPTPTLSPAPTVTPTPSPTAVPTPTPTPSPTPAPTGSTVRLHAFIHSLVNHEPTDDVKTISYLGGLYQSYGVELRACAQYGFLPTPPARCQLGWGNVLSAWSEDASGSFSDYCVDSILVTVRNFRNEDEYLDIAALVDAQGWTEANKATNCQVKYYFYEPWSDAGFHPRNGASFASYFNDQLDSNVSLYTGIFNAANAQLNVPYTYIPAAQILAHLALGHINGVTGLTWDELFEDSSPHGRASVYYVTALVTYITITNELPPPGYVPPTTVLPIIYENYGNISYFIYNYLNQ